MLLASKCVTHVYIRVCADTEAGILSCIDFLNDVDKKLATEKEAVLIIRSGQNLSCLYMKGFLRPLKGSWEREQNSSLLRWFAEEPPLFVRLFLRTCIPVMIVCISRNICLSQRVDEELPPVFFVFTHVCCRMEVARRKLQKGEVAECKKLVGI